VDYVTRSTAWHDPAGNVVPVSLAVLDPETWDVLSCVTEHVGPFDDVPAIVAQSVEVAVALARGQYPGQQSLAFD